MRTHHARESSAGSAPDASDPPPRLSLARFSLARLHALALELRTDAARIFLPARCLLCEREAIPAHRSLLCGPCGDDWPQAIPGCSRCGDDLEPHLAELEPSPSTLHGHPPQERTGHCARCTAEPPPFARARALTIYEGPVVQAIHALKFQQAFGLGQMLGERLADVLPNLLGDAAYAAIVPTPIHWRRRIQRGYNQSELLAIPISRRYCIPLVQGLERTRHTEKQSSLGQSDRQVNLKDALTVPPAVRPRLSGARCLLIDDVLTTGATARACAALLCAAGALEVDVLTIARTL